VQENETADEAYGVLYSSAGPPPLYLYLLSHVLSNNTPGFTIQNNIQYTVLTVLSSLSIENILSRKFPKGGQKSFRVKTFVQ
jgi:hypothetical protein